MTLVIGNDEYTATRTKGTWAKDTAKNYYT
jgi:hypothetical protein